MNTRRMIGLGLIVMALLVGTQSASAGGIIVSLDRSPTDVIAGEAFSVGFTVRSMHDGQPIPDLKPQITATDSNAVGDQRLVFDATSDGMPGHYVAMVTLPAAGVWTWAIQPFGATEGDFPTPVLAPLTVLAPVSAAQTQPSAAAPLVPELGIRLPIIAAILLAVAGIVLLARRRRVVQA